MSVGLWVCVFDVGLIRFGLPWSLRSGTEQSEDCAWVCSINKATLHLLVGVLQFPPLSNKIIQNDSLNTYLPELEKAKRTYVN